MKKRGGMMLERQWNRSDPQTESMVAELYRSGLGYKAISCKTGILKATVAKIVRRTCGVERGRKNHYALPWWVKASNLIMFQIKSELKHAKKHDEDHHWRNHRVVDIYLKTAFQNRKYKSCIKFRIKKRLRNTVGKFVRGEDKSATTQQLVGCSMDHLLQHLASMFKPGMSWDNYGQWHIDHIRPCASFDLTKPTEQAACFHYTNLQPLWEIENRKKGCKWK